MKKKKQKKFLFNFFKKNSRGVIADYLIWIILAVAVIAIVTIIIFIQKGTGESLISKLGNLFKGGSVG